MTECRCELICQIQRAEELPNDQIGLQNFNPLSRVLLPRGFNKPFAFTSSGRLLIGGYILVGCVGDAGNFRSNRQR